MSIIQKIKYNSENTYFAGFIQALIDESKILASVEQKNKEIILKIDNSDENKVNEFNGLLSKYLPHSIFLDEIDTINSDENIKPSKFRSKDFNISPCAKCIETISDPSSKYYLDETLKCNHYSNDSNNIYDDTTLFSPHFSEDCVLLVTDTSKISELFIITEDEVKALLSIEKPTIKVTIKDNTLKDLVGDSFIKIKAIYNIKSLLASINAKESGVDYLFFYPSNDLEVVVVQKNLSIIKASRIATELETLHSDKVLNRFLNIKKEASFQGKQDKSSFEKSALGVYLSTKGISFILSNEVDTKKVINFEKFDLASVIKGFSSNKSRAKLMEKLREKYPHIVDVLDKENLDLWETISIILEIKNKTYEGVCNKSYEFKGNGGVKIDTNFDDNGFNYEDFIGSIISFKLAGIDTNYLAYSIFEALADMSISVLNQLKTKFKVNDFIMMGDMFSNNILYSRILNKFQLNNPYFSKSFALDD